MAQSLLAATTPVEQSVEVSNVVAGQNESVTRGEVQEWFAANHLEEYGPAVVTLGYNKLVFFRGITEEELAELVQKLQMPTPHARTFRSALAQCFFAAETLPASTTKVPFVPPTQPRGSTIAAHAAVPIERRPSSRHQAASVRATPVVPSTVGFCDGLYGSDSDKGQCDCLVKTTYVVVFFLLIRSGQVSNFFQSQICTSDECKDNIWVLYVVALIMLCCCVIQCKDITHRHGFRTGLASETARQARAKQSAIGSWWFRT